MDQRIGVLQTAKGVVYYAFVNGYDQPEFRSADLSEVEAALAGKKPVAKKKAPKVLRTYIVTVTPKYEYHMGLWRSGAYTVESSGYTREDAIKRVREQRRWEEGSQLCAATYRAVLK